MGVRIHHGTIVNLAVDVIVNAANTELVHGGGVAAAIARAAGPALTEESRKVGFCPLGEIAETSAGRLKAQRVFHIPTIDYTTGRHATLDLITAVTRKALARCREQGYKSIAFPLLGAGVVGLERVAVARAIAQATREFPELDIIICAYGAADRQALEQVWGKA